MPDPKRSLSLVQPPQQTPPPPAFNPYAAPKSAVNPWQNSTSGGRVTRMGKVLVMDRNAELPHLCVKCAQPESKRLVRKLSWHNPWLALLVLAGLLVYAIVAVIVRKQATVSVGLCERHQRQRVIGIASTCGLILLSVIGFVSGSAPGVLLGLLCIPASVVVGLRIARPVWPVLIDDREVRLRGAGEEFLRKLDRAA